MSDSPPKQEILLPVKAGFIVFTLALALLANLLPWQGVLFWLHPDFAAVVLLYWCVQQPRKVGMGAGFVVGFLMDVANGSLLGQHALAYTVMTYAGIILHRRLQMFNPGQQMLHVLPLLLISQVIIVLTRLITGANFPGWGYFLASATGAALWPLLGAVLKIPQRPRHDPNAV